MYCLRSSWISSSKTSLKRLVIFDLDETLIHCQREELLSEDATFKFIPDIWIDI